MSSKIVVVGSCNMDFSTYAPKLPDNGETIYGTKYCVGFGGKGANQCVAAAKLGASASLVAKLGNDHNGKMYMENMKKYNVNTDSVMMCDGADTGIAAITVGQDGGNTIVIVPGVNNFLSVADVENSRGLISSASILLCQMEIDINTTAHALKLGQELGVKTILNLAPAVKVGNKLLRYCDILCLNETEASLLINQTIQNVESALQWIKSIIDMGCKSCIITLGKEGCVYCNGVDEPYHVAVNFTVNAVDTTGAGDCFIGALAYFLAYHNNLSMQDILQRSNIVAANSVTGLGTQTSFPIQNDLDGNLFS